MVKQTRTPIFHISASLGDFPLKILWLVLQEGGSGHDIWSQTVPMKVRQICRLFQSTPQWQTIQFPILGQSVL